MVDFKKALLRFVFGESTVVGDLLYPIIWDDVPWWKALVGVIPLGGIVYFFGDEESGDDDEDKKQENELATDGGRDMSEDSGGRRDGRGSSRDEGVYRRDLSSDSGDEDGFLSKAGGVFSGIGSVLGKVFGHPKIFVALIGLPIGLMILLTLVSVFTGGTGEGYGLLFTDMFAPITSFFNDIFGGLFGTIGSQISAAIGFIFCAGDAGCLAQLSQNQSQDIGAEQVGEVFKVKMIGPSVTTGTDVSVRDKKSKVPVEFSLKNIRRGNHAQTARNVSYKTEILQPNILPGSDSVCGTDWTNISKYGEDIEEGDELYDVNNILRGGESVSPLSRDLTLYECGLLNPGTGLGKTFKAKSNVRYNYGAYSILKVEAMADDNWDKTRRDVNAQVVKTPAQANIYVRGPLLYNSGAGDGISIPARLRVIIGTNQEGTKFRVDADEFWLKDSRFTTHNEDNCPGLNQTDENSNKYVFSDRVKEQFEKQQDPEGKDRWYSKSNRPPTASCEFELTEPEEISPTGETLTMEARVNYTVKYGSESDPFQLENMECTTQNCPYVRPLNASNIKEKTSLIGLDIDNPNVPVLDEASKEEILKKIYAKCPVASGQDDIDGCSTVDSWERGERSPDTDAEIEEEGVFALRLDEKGEDPRFVTDCSSEDTGYYQVVGVDQEELKDAHDGSVAFHHTDNGDWELVEETNEACSEEE